MTNVDPPQGQRSNQPERKAIMQTHTFKGRVEEIGKVQTFSSGFTKCRVVVDDSTGRYPNPVPFDAVRENIDKLKAVGVGDIVRVTFNLRGREYNGRVYGDMNLLDIEVETPAASVTPPEVDTTEYIRDEETTSEEPPF